MLRAHRKRFQERHKLKTHRSLSPKHVTISSHVGIVLNDNITSFESDHGKDVIDLSFHAVANYHQPYEPSRPEPKASGKFSLLGGRQDNRRLTSIAPSPSHRRTVSNAETTYFRDAHLSIRPEQLVPPRSSGVRNRPYVEGIDIDSKGVARSRSFFQGG